jgi:hypothetical protein
MGQGSPEQLLVSENVADATLTQFKFLGGVEVKIDGRPV